jgi:hypothetical protein
MREIKISEIGSYATEQVEKLLRAAVFETDSLLKQASPVDTGRFRVSWAVGENAAPYQGAPEGEYKGQVPPPLRVNYQMEKVGNTYSIHNNLPYAEPLANGSSKQASPGWVQGVAKDVQTRVKTAAEKIGRTS